MTTSGNGMDAEWTEKRCLGHNTRKRPHFTVIVLRHIFSHWSSFVHGRTIRSKVHVLYKVSSRTRDEMQRVAMRIYRLVLTARPWPCVPPFDAAKLCNALPACVTPVPSPLSRAKQTELKQLNFSSAVTHATAAIHSRAIAFFTVLFLSQRDGWQQGLVYRFFHSAHVLWNKNCLRSTPRCSSRHSLTNISSHIFDLSTSPFLKKLKTHLFHCCFPP